MGAVVSLKKREYKPPGRRRSLPDREWECLSDQSHGIMGHPDLFTGESKDCRGF